ncbi:MAG: SEC-C domain-containing protein [Actinomycetota bacterium]|nr:SEC-C domain-containing protein [Actinomycetota bacterium]
MRTPAEEEITRAAHAILGGGPVPRSVLVERLAAQGALDPLRDEGVDDAELGMVITEEILGDEIWVTTDDTVFLVDTLTDGMVLTHRLTDQELGAGVVAINPDLEVLDWDEPDGLDIVGGGGRLTSRPLDDSLDDSTGSFAGPHGWLGGFAAGDMVAFRRHGASVEVVLAGELADGQCEVDRLAATVAGRIRAGEGEESSPLLLDALAVDQEAFRHPVDPLGELLERAGLERRGFTFGPRGQTWFTHAERFQQRRRREIIEAWDFDTCCVKAFDVVDAAFRRFVDDRHAEIDAAALTDSVGHSAVGLAFADYLQSGTSARRRRLADFAADLVERAPDGADAAPAWLLAGSAADDGGDVIAAEAHVGTARRLDPDYGPAAAALSRYQIDRSDVSGAIASLRHPDLDPEGPVLAYLLHLDRPYRVAGRNQACPCGSGRKFKQCCVRNRSVPLAGRTGLLSFKLSLFASRPEHSDSRLLLAETAVDPEDPDPSASAQRLAVDSMIVDLALWEGGLADRYLEERGALLPADELELLTRFVDEPRRLWEITAVDEGATLDLRETKTGERLSVDEHAGSIGRQIGEFLLARVARLEGVNQLLGSVMDVPLRVRPSLIEVLDDDPGGGALAAWYGAAIAAPRLANREGEAMILCSAAVTTDQPAEAIHSVLDQILDPEDDDTWTEVWSEPGGDRLVRGTVRLDGDRLLLEANSEVRIERLLDAVTGVLPDARITADERINARDLITAGGDGRPLPAPGPLPAGIHEAVDQLIQGKEIDWLDESIPALAGLTPRQAAEDPTRREDLESVLREMEPAAGAVGGQGFDPRRIRRHLGM